MEDKRGWLHTGSALIRAILHIDPNTLSDIEWCYQVRMAVWAENRAMQSQYKIQKGRF